MLVVSERRTRSEVEDCANSALVAVADHIRDLRLLLAVDKMETVIFKSQYGRAEQWLQIGDQAVQLDATLKYLGIVLESNGTWFGAHFQAAADKARRVMAALSGLMPNIGGPREGRRRLLTSVAHSVMMYGAPTWASTLKCNRQGLNVLNAVQ